MSIEKYTDDEIVFIKNLKDEGLTWHEVTVKFNSKFKCSRSFDSVKKAYYKYADIGSIEEYSLNAVVSNLRNKRSKSITARENKLLLEAWTSREDILEAIDAVVKKASKLSLKTPKVKKDAKKSDMTLELLLSDLHFGKKTETFDLSVAKRRLNQITATVLKEIDRAKVHYNVERIIIALMGDIIESSTMHGVESAKGCEFGNSRQVQESMDSLFELVILPLTKTGLKIDIVGVTGNHDRTEEHRTYHNPGEENRTWIMYNGMKKFCEYSGLKNVSWTIPIKPYQMMQIYGENVLYEHFDNVKGANLRSGIESLKSKRTNQLSAPITFIRGGHYHEPAEFGLGKITVNGSLCGNDSYADVNGYDCAASQTLNFYIKKEKTDSVKRMTCFYKRFLIQLN